MSQNNIIKTNQVDFLNDDGTVAHSLYLSAGALTLDGSPVDTGGTTPAEITLADGHILVGQATGKAGDKALSGEATISNLGVMTLDNAAVIAKLLTGFTAGAGTLAATDSILAAIQKLAGNTQNLTVIGNLLTGFTSGAGTLAATDSILQAIQKLSGNTQNLTVIGNLLTGFTSGAGTVAGTDSILAAVQKLDGNVKYQQLEATGALTQANITSMYTTAIDLVASPGAGKIIIVDEVEILHTYATAAYTGGGDVTIRYSTPTTIILPDVTLVTAASSTNRIMQPTIYTLDATTGTAIGFDMVTNAAKSVQISNLSGVFGAGNASNILKWRVKYHVLTLLT